MQVLPKTARHGKPHAVHHEATPADAGTGPRTDHLRGKPSAGASRPRTRPGVVAFEGVPELLRCAVLAWLDEAGVLVVDQLVQLAGAREAHQLGELLDVVRRA